MKRARGLTLVELLVVLTILVALTTVAIRATEGTLQQSRYDATVRTLQSLEDAVLGPVGEREPDGTARATGFVADLGRLPQAVDVSGTLFPQELWANVNALGAFGIQGLPAAAPVQDGDVLQAAGWRDAYLRLPPGVDRLRDGWGNPFDLVRADGSPAVAGDPVGGLISRGADGAAGGTGFNADLTLAFVDGASDRVSAQLSGNVRWNNGGSLEEPDASRGAGVAVVLYEPDPATGELRAVTLPALLSPGTGPGRPALTYTLDTTTGPRALRAYQGDEADAAAIVANASNPRSRLVRVVVSPGGQAQDLILE